MSLQRRNQTYRQMVNSQRGFFFGLYASSILLSAILIGLFAAFVFKIGYFQAESVKAVAPSKPHPSTVTELLQSDFLDF